MSYLTPAEVADILGVEKKVVLRAIHAGKLPALKIGRLYRVHPDALAALEHRPEPRQEEAAELPAPAIAGGRVVDFRKRAGRLDP